MYKTLEFSKIRTHFYDSHDFLKTETGIYNASVQNSQIDIAIVTLNKFKNKKRKIVLSGSFIHIENVSLYSYSVIKVFCESLTDTMSIDDVVIEFIQFRSCVAFVVVFSEFYWSLIHSGSKVCSESGMSGVQRGLSSLVGY